MGLDRNDMPIMIAGIDEAGYGPLLGPLIISAVAFELPGSLTDEMPDIAAMLAPAVALRPPLPHAALMIADSKLVHRLQNGLVHLELACILAAEQGCGSDTPTTLEQLARSLGWQANCPLPWYNWKEAPVPRWADEGTLGITRSMVTGRMAARKIQLSMARTAIIDEQQFNQLTAKTNNKAAVLSTHGMMLLRELVDRYGQGDAWIVVDKNGARDRYLDMLMRTFPEAMWRVYQESPLLSRYQWARPEGVIRIDFQQKGEQACLATAWASMICKYIRERAMEQFNIWWQSETGSGVKPTAGYYSDAQRWLSEMAPYLERCGPPTEQWVRTR